MASAQENTASVQVQMLLFITAGSGFEARPDPTSAAEDCMQGKFSHYDVVARGRNVGSKENWLPNTRFPHLFCGLSLGWSFGGGLLEA